MRQEGEMLVFLVFADERLLGGEGHHRQADGFVDPVVDDSCGLIDDIETMAVSHRQESGTQEIVLGHDFPHVQSIVETLHAMHRRAASGMLHRDRPLATKRKITRNLRNHVREVISDRWLIELQLCEELARLNPPFDNDLLLAFPKDLREVLDRAMFFGCHYLNTHTARAQQ